MHNFELFVFEFAAKCCCDLFSVRHLCHTDRIVYQMLVHYFKQFWSIFIIVKRNNFAILGFELG